MTNKKISQKQLCVLCTALLSVLIFVAGMIQSCLSPHELNRRDNPVLGEKDARVELLLIEDLNCGYCRRFTQEILPKVMELYVNTGKASYTFVPVAFLKGSDLLANAGLSVYHINPERFETYLHALFSQFAEEQDLIPLAERVGGIDLAKLQEAIASKRYFPLIQKNLIWAKKFMGPTFGTPALFVNGVRTSTTSLESVSEQVEQLL